MAQSAEAGVAIMTANVRRATITETLPRFMASVYATRHNRSQNRPRAPNCYFEVVDKTIWIRAGRDIRRGEELTYDYRVVGDRTIRCRCRPGSPNWL